jgi:hypothetical protein
LRKLIYPPEADLPLACRAVRIQLSALVLSFVEGINSLGGSGKASGAIRLLPSGPLP